MSGLPEHVVLYDGVCGFCDLSVRFLLDRDREGRLHFAPLQGETAAAVRARHPEWPPDLDSLVLVRQTAAGEQVTWYSRGVLSMLAVLPPPWRYAAALRCVPRFLADPAYKLLARVRYRIFGTLDTCRIPDEAEAARFLP